METDIFEYPGQNVHRTHPKVDLKTSISIFALSLCDDTLEQVHLCLLPFPALGDEQARLRAIVGLMKNIVWTFCQLGLSSKRLLLLSELIRPEEAGL